MVGPAYAEFICIKNKDNGGNGNSVGSNGNEMTIRKLGVLPQTDSNPSLPNRATPNNLGCVPLTHPGIAEPKQRGLISVRRPQ